MGKSDFFTGTLATKRAFTERLRKINFRKWNEYSTSADETEIRLYHKLFYCADFSLMFKSVHVECVLSEHKFP